MDAARAIAAGRVQPGADRHWTHGLRNPSGSCLPLACTGLAPWRYGEGAAAGCVDLSAVVHVLGIFHPFQPVWRAPGFDRVRVGLLGRHCAGGGIRHRRCDGGEEGSVKNHSAQPTAPNGLTVPASERQAVREVDAKRRD